MAVSVRLRRLQADFEQIQARFRDSRYIIVRKVTGDPPERYEIEYRVRGLVLQNDGSIVESAAHVAEIVLTRAYPHRAPHCKMLTAVFHPNIDPGAICIGDHWAASESLADLIIRIGQLLAYQTYNTKSPLNGEAARWTDEHRDLLPVDSSDLAPPEADSAIPPPLPASNVQSELAHCQNCGATSSDQHPLVQCVEGHQACQDCVVTCDKCHATLCLLCKSATCGVCGKKGCVRCLNTCDGCGESVCPEHLAPCADCDKCFCTKCLDRCASCGKAVCKSHMVTCKSCGKPSCAKCVSTCPLCPPGTTHHQTELATCSKCGHAVCGGHLHVSAVSGAKVCDVCGVPCASCALWVTNAEVVKCVTCGKPMCPTCAKVCGLCGSKLCPTDAISCAKCGRITCSKCSLTCPVCGRKVCKTASHAGQCAVCKRLVCAECLNTCADCKKKVCAPHTFHCSQSNKDLCDECVEVCMVCNEVRDTTHVSQCSVCGGTLCETCANRCSRCGAIVCPQHTFALSRTRGFCLNCSRRREKMFMRIAIPSVVVGVILIIVIFWLLLAN